MVMAAPAPMPADPPEKKEPGKLRKDLNSIGSNMLDGVNRGVYSGALQFAKLGAVGGAIFALPFVISLGWIPALGWVVGAAAGGAVIGAIGVGVINLVGGLFNGLRDNFHRGRNERAAKRAMEQQQAPEQKPTMLQKLGFGGPANGVQNDGAAPNHITTGEYSPAGSGVKVPRASDHSADVPAESTGSYSSTTPTASFGQGPSSGGSWEELVRKNSGTQAQIR